MKSDDIVYCAGGLRVAQRGSPPPGRPGDLQVGPVGVLASPTREPIETRRSDNVIWRRHWSEPDRLLIDYVDLASVQVEDATGIVTFDQELPHEMEQHLVFDHVLPLVLARRGQLVLHAGVISLDEAGVVLVGASGAGKSTLTAFAWQHGWAVGGDDGAVVTPGLLPVVEATYATVRLTKEAAGLLGLDQTNAPPVVGKTRFAGDARRGLQAGVVPLVLIAVVEPVGENLEARFHPLSGAAAHARLFGSTFHSDLVIGRNLSVTVDALAQVIDVTTVGRLSVPRGRAGLAATERLLRSQVTKSGLVSASDPGLS